MKNTHQTRVFFSPHPSSNFSKTGPASRNTILSAIRFSREMGFEPHLERRSLGNGAVLKYYADLARSLFRAEVFLTLYPYAWNPISGNPLLGLDCFFLKLISRLRTRLGTVLYIVDLPIDQALAVKPRASIGKETFDREKEIFEKFDVLCVFNDSMKETLAQRYRIPKRKFVEFEILDHSSDYTPQSKRGINAKEWTIAYAGNYNRAYVGDWARELPQSKITRYEFWGFNWNWLSKLGRSDILDRGFLDDEKLIRALSEDAHFGIIHSSSREVTAYQAFGSTSKMGTYLVAGLPILVSSESKYVSSLVSRYGVGLTFTRLNEIPFFVGDVSTSDYLEMRKRCLLLGEKLKRGEFFKRAVNAAIRKLGSSYLRG